MIRSTFQMARTMGWLALCLPLVALCLPMLAQGQPLERYAFSAPQMGTEFRIVLYAADSLQAQHAAEAAFARIDTLNAHLSDYLPESELNCLSATAGSGQPVPVSDDLWRVLASAQQFSRDTDGAFDVTVGPLTKLWRYAVRRNTLPPADELAAARKAVGYQALRLDEMTQTATLDKPGMRLDLGGIAKGFAADEALAVLQSFGLNQALVDAGGDLRLGAAPPDALGWEVEIAAVDSAGQLVQAVHYLANAAVAASGDRYRYVEADGVRYSHILDPRTGMGVTHAHLVTVVAPTATAADALASALSVMGAEAGLDFARKQPQVEARILERGANGSFQVYGTKHLHKRMAKE